MESLGSEFFQQVASVPSIEEKVSLFYGYVCNCGFTDAFYSRVTVDAHGEPSRLEFRHWDPVWRKIYEEKQYSQVDWAINAARYQEGPFFFGKPTIELTPKDTEFCADAAAHNRLNGFAMPIKDITGLVAGFSATGAPSKPTMEQVSRVIAAGLLLDHHVKTQLVAKASKIVGVTPREIKLIRQLASGFNMADIARKSSKSEQWIRKSCLQTTTGRVNALPVFLKRLHDVFDHLFGIGQKHHCIVFEEQFILNACIPGAHAALNEEDGTSIFYV